MKNIVHSDGGEGRGVETQGGKERQAHRHTGRRVGLLRVFTADLIGSSLTESRKESPRTKYDVACHVLRTDELQG